MTLYFENPVNFSKPGTVTTNGVWHSSAPLLVLSSYTSDAGGTVAVFDEFGFQLSDVEYPLHRASQVSAIAWHPEKLILACGWENGELKIWNGEDREFFNVAGPHKAPVTLLGFSENGGRLVTCDTGGSLVAWKVDNKGETLIIYHHDLKETIMHLTFRITVKQQFSYDIEGLAKAAVNGDEHALDLFSNWRPKTTARKFRVSQKIESQCFYIATRGGSVYHVNQTGECIEVLNTEGVPLISMTHHPSKDGLVIMMEGFTVGYFSIDTTGHLSELSKVKLNGKFQAGYGALDQGLVWAGAGFLAILTGDLTVRVWNVETNDNYVLPTSLPNYPDEKPSSFNEIFTCISYSKVNHTICAGTNIGRLYFWTRNLISPESDEAWDLSNIGNVNGTVKQLMWGSVHLRQPLLAVNCVNAVYIMKEQNISACYTDDFWAVQKSTSQVLLETDVAKCLLRTDVQVTDMSIGTNTVAITDGRTIVFYETAREEQLYLKLDANLKETVGGLNFNFLNSIRCDNEKIVMNGKDVVVLTPKNVLVKSIGGIILTTIPSTAAEGEPIGIDVNCDYLTVFTMEGFIKLFKLSEQDAKLVVPIRNLYDLCNDFGEIIQAKSNSNGTKIALTLAGANLVPDGKLYVWDTERDDLIHYDFHKYGDYVEDDSDKELEKATSNRSVYDEMCTNCIPVSVAWDKYDPRLLVCDVRRLKNDKKGFEKNGGVKNESHLLLTIFVSLENDIRIQDVKAVDDGVCLLGVSTPYIIILEKLNVVRIIMTDFVGLEKCNKATRDAVLNFSYNLSLGNMDAAFKSIKLVQSKGVWGSLARMCVKTRRLDVAGVCLGHLGDARAARAVRLAINDKTLPNEAKLAVLAIQLGMISEAEQLYRECQRYDLLNRLYQYSDKFEAAEELAEAKDRIHIKNTHYLHAKTLAREGDYNAAILHYGKAGTQRQDVPRIFLDRPDLLEAYMNKNNDPEMQKWWGQYVESQGDMATALKIYAAAGDIYSQVRVLCYLGENEKAAQLARNANDKLAYCHMARHYETSGDIADAVVCFVRAGAHSNSIRLCKEHHMDDDLWNIGMVAGKREKIECAKYFEENGNLERATVLYHRAGLVHKSLDIAFKTQQYEMLLQIASELDAASDPKLIQKCADYFCTNQQFDKAVDLLAVVKKFEEATKLCLEHNVMITEELAKKLTPEKDDVEEATRKLILENIAESLMLQGNYSAAAKKFTQAGDKTRAMKALLKSGNTDRIIFFATKCREKDIYIMAANYLQSLDWQNQPEVLKHIIMFYTKAKALDLLANFYMACAQLEIDEFQNYEKALGAMAEASRCLAKVISPKDPVQHRKACELVEERLADVKKFIEIKKIFERGDVENGMKQCRELLLSRGQTLEDSVRRGDIYGLMIQMCIKNGSFIEGKKLFDELQQLLKGNVAPTYYVNKETIEALAVGLNVPLTNLLPAAVKKTIHEGSDEIKEQIYE